MRPAAILTLILLAGCTSAPRPRWARDCDPLSAEKHFARVWQLTSSGTHAEAYFSPDGRRLILQAVRTGDPADQIYILDLATGDSKRVSTGDGKCTCAWFLPDGRFVYSSTHHHAKEPPPKPDRSKGYVWPLYRTFDLFMADPSDGSLHQLTTSDGYDAETTLGPDGRTLVLTSHRDNDVSLYTMQIDGTGMRRVTMRHGYAGGAVFTPNGSWLVYRAFYPRNDAEKEEFERLLRERTLHPVNLELYRCRPAGSEETAITQNGKVNFAPYPLRDGKRVIFTSDLDAVRRGQYGMYVVGMDGTGLERITHHDGFDGFPCFSADGKYLVWISDRNAKRPHELNVFMAEWKE
ncbi:MAG: PD40 domain-containing protein [Planctomycetes bacterium]|nr:PD40 domain-containing protein [Planctomycetota bacterium]